MQDREHGQKTVLSLPLPDTQLMSNSHKCNPLCRIMFLFTFQECGLVGGVLISSLGRCFSFSLHLFLPQWSSSTQRRGAGLFNPTGVGQSPRYLSSCGPAAGDEGDGGWDLLLLLAIGWSWRCAVRLSLSRVSSLLLLSSLPSRGDTTPQQLLCTASMSHSLSALIYPSPDPKSPSQKTSGPLWCFPFSLSALFSLSFFPLSTVLSPSEHGDLSSDLKPSADAGLSSRDFHSTAAGARPPGFQPRVIRRDENIPEKKARR